MGFDPITGNEVQVGNGRVAIHAGDNVDEQCNLLEKKLKRIYEDETAHKIVRISYQRGSSTFFTNAGYEDQLYNDIREYVQSVVEREYFPLVFDFSAFVSYSPLRVVKSDKDEE